MTDPLFWLRAGAGFALGLGAGAAWFATLRANARLFAEGRVAAAGALQALRLAAAGALFYALAHHGAAALVAAFAAFLLARTVALRRAAHAVTQPPLAR